MRRKLTCIDLIRQRITIFYGKMKDIACEGLSLKTVLYIDVFQFASIQNIFTMQKAAATAATYATVVDVDSGAKRSDPLCVRVESRGDGLTSMSRYSSGKP